MAAIAFVAMSFTVIGWMVVPFISFLVSKFLSYLDFNLSRKLRELELQIIPSLKVILGDVTEQRILRGAKDEGKGYGSDLKILGELDKDLKSALCDAEDLRDLIEYRRIEKKVIGIGAKSLGTTIRDWVLQAIGDCMTCGKRSSFGQKLWQCAENQNQKLRYLVDKLQQNIKSMGTEFCDLLAKLVLRAKLHVQMFRDLPLRAKLVQCVQSLNMYIHQGAAGQPPMPDAPAAEFRDDIEQATTATPSPTPDAPSTSNPQTPNAVPNSAGSATEFRGHNHQGSAVQAPMLDASSNSLVQIAWDLFGNVFSRLRSFYLAVRLLRDWSYEPVGIKNDDDTATECVLSINEIISLRKRIKNIEYIVTESKKSRLLNQNSSSRSTFNDVDNESSSSGIVKNSAEASISSTQKEIDDLHRNIEQKVLGRDKDCERISRMLHESPVANAATSSASKPYSVIGIYGISGSGKSTLAQYVCEHEKAAGHFDHIMFIHVGQTFSVGNVFRDMLGKITESRLSNDRDLKSLKIELEENLKDKRFLLVLDDLWVNDDNQKERDILVDTLSAALSGSRILVTAQKKDAAEALGAQEQISIPDLEEEVYLSLFMHHARQDAGTDYGEYKRIGRKIANRLCRSPIAAVTVGKQLQNKSISFWETTANLDVLDKTMGALWWSYQQLGVDIRRCFAYCCIFPKGYRLGRDELVRIWIAQGFVSARSNATKELEDVGQHYIEELVTFSFLQVQRKSFIKQAEAHTIFSRPCQETLTIHDLLHELAEKVSGSDLFRIGLNDLPKDIPRWVHHLFIETKNVAEIVKKILDLGNLRTLIVHNKIYAKHVERNHDLEDVLGRLFMRLTKLRVLIIKVYLNINEVSVPVSIYQMKHLRYLCFASDVHHLILPSTISKLYHIQVLDIPYYQASYPEDMANLICLRHIFGVRLSCPNIGRLTSLQTLRWFRVKEGQGFELKQLKHLNKLRGTLSIEGLEIVGSKEEALEAYLIHKEGLRRLELEFGWDKRFGRDVQADVLEGLCPPKDLQELRISFYRGSRYPSWLLSRRHPDTPKQRLHTLQLWSCSQLASIPEDSELFIGLRELAIVYCDWDRLPDNMERLLSLQTLRISACKDMKLVPKLPVESLKKISIYGCGVLSTTCKQEGHENWRKIQQIPEKVIR